ncbi:MAG TPA: iron ABC transporter permease [Stellaceae bacterium]|nr:iron ABC transporter permease [Stellaceae bacterium]
MTAAALAADSPPRARFFNLEHWVAGAAVAALIVLIVLPLLSLLWGSVAGQDGLTLGYFARVVTNRLYFQALFNSLTLGAWTGLFSVLIGVPLAWAVVRTDLPGRGFVKLTATLSYLSPPFLLAIAYVNLFSPRAGVVNAFLRGALPGHDLTFNIFSMPGLVLVTVPHAFPFVYLLAASALASVDASFEESAQILGAGKLRTALSVTLPLVAPAILSGALIGFVNAIALFGSQAIVGLPARIFTLPTRIYALFDYPPQYGLASALSLVFVALTVAALYLQRAYLARRSFVTLAGKGARPQRLSLGLWRWPLFAFCVLIFLVAILLPYGSLLAVSLSKSWGLAFWKNLTLANYAFVLFQYDVTQRAILNSLLLASLAATSAVLLGAAIGWIDLRTALKGRRFLDYASLVPLGLPGIVMAAALIQFWLKTPVPLYGTLAILFLAYCARYLPLGVRAANGALRQIDPSLEESARILGASWGETMREVTLPLMRSSLFAGWILVFVPAIQELSASILLFSSKSMTVAVAVYNLYENGYIEPVAALALINAAIIGAAIWLANRVGGAASRVASLS